MKKTIFFAFLITFLSQGFLSASEENGNVALPNAQKIFTIKTFEQHKLFAKQQTSWKLFVARNPSWETWWNPLTQNPHRAWGEGIRVEGYSSISESNAADAGWKFVQMYSSVLNLRTDELRLLQAEDVNGKWYYKFKQQYKGLDVLNTYVDLRMMSDGRVFMMGSDFIPNIDVNTSPSLGIASAKEFAKAGLEYIPGSDHISGGDLYVLPLHFDDKIDSRLVYNFTINQNTTEIWNTYVDAHSGEVVWRYNLVQNFLHDESHPSPQIAAKTASIIHGKVTVNISPVSYLLGTSEVPLANMYVNINGKNVITDDNGEYSLDLGSEPNGTVSVRLAGPYAIANRTDAASAQIQKSVPAGTEFNILWDDQNSNVAERNAFYHINVVRKFIRTIDPSTDLRDLDKQIAGNVNVRNSTADTCNAFWNGTNLNFFRESFTCANLALVADVIYHEYGHAINQFYYFRRTQQGMTNPSLSEATADITANMLTDDPRIGIGFIKNGANQGIIRNADNKLRYPDNFGTEQLYYHDNGMILTGAVWDMRKKIGLDISRKLSHFAKKGTPDGANGGEAFVNYFLELLVADDDDANLKNGTPHSNDIIPAFVKHGIPASITINHTPLTDQDGVVQNDYPISGSMSITAAIPKSDTTVTLSLQRTRLIWSLNNWKGYYEKELNVTGNNFSDVFPKQNIGSIVRYYIEAIDNFGELHHSPMKAPTQTYLYLVGFVSKLFANMEQDDGWIVNPDKDDDALTGKWIRAIPIGTPAQPDTDHTPGLQSKMCWVTGNATVGAGMGTNDVDDGKTTLQTATYDLTKYINPVIRYFRWYNNAPPGGASPTSDTWLVEISSDGGKNWIDLERTMVSIADWAAMVFPVKDLITPTDKVVVRFTASDVDPQSLIEAAVDDFEILDVNTSINAADNLTTPSGFDLKQNYPNPFSTSSNFAGEASTLITYTIPAKSFVTLKVFNSFGQEIKTIVSSDQEAGTHSIRFTALEHAAGLYFYELIAGGKRIVKKMMYVK